MKIGIALVAVLLLTALSVTGFAYSGLYDVSASSPHSRIANWFFSTVSHASVERRARDIAVPELDDERLVLAGINDFNSMCIGCHGRPGKEPEAMGQGLNPPAPDLAHSAEELTEAELFWVTKHGFKMSGMPAWGATHDDDSIWPVVAFMTRLPSLNESAYQEMLEAAAGHGHHDGEVAGGEPGQTENVDTTDSDVHVHEDGSEHIHEQAAESKAPAEHDNSAHEHNDG